MTIINDKKITAELEKIRRKIGAPKVPFVPQPYPEDIDFTPKNIQEIRDIFHPSGFLIKNGHPVFAYIRDHTQGLVDNPWGRRRIHFTVCEKLEYMRRIDRFDSRYRVTNRDDNRYEIDHARGTARVELYPCQFCLAELNYQCFKIFSSGSSERGKIIIGFDAKEALNLIREHFDVFRLETRELRTAAISTGYTVNQRSHSLRFRRMKNYICDKCHCNFKTDPGLTDTHHVDSDKTNNRFNNSQCLCKLCHADKHPHYPVRPDHAAKIRRLRREQGIKNVPG